MSRPGLVLGLHGARARVSTARRGLCGECSDKVACGMHMGDSVDSSEVVLADNPLGARPGDVVEIDLPPTVELKVSFLVWMMPLIGLVAGAAIGSAVHVSVGLSVDVATLLGAISGTAAAYAVLRRIDRKAAGDRRLEQRIVRITMRVACSDVQKPQSGPR